MTRWLALLLLLASCSGCALFDDYDDGAMPWGAPAPQGSCGQPIRNISASQTAEPPLRQ